MSLAENYFDLDAGIKFVELDTEAEGLLNAKMAEMVVSEYKTLECSACDKHFGYQYRKDPDMILCNEYSECMPLMMKSLREKDVRLNSSPQPVLINRDTQTSRRNAMTPLSPMPPGFSPKNSLDGVSIDSQKIPDEMIYSGSSSGVMTRSHCVAAGIEPGSRRRNSRSVGKSLSYQKPKRQAPLEYSVCQDMRDINNNQSGMY